MSESQLDTSFAPSECLEPTEGGKETQIIARLRSSLLWLLSSSELNAEDIKPITKLLIEEARESLTLS